MVPSATGVLLLDNRSRLCHHGVSRDDANRATNSVSHSTADSASHTTANATSHSVGSS